MGKTKKSKRITHIARPYSKPLKSKEKRALDGKARNLAPPNAPVIPFEPTDRVLLVGEGDFSFACSLLQTHGCVNLVATSYDARSAALLKYPQAASHIKTLENELESKVIFGVDATKLGNGNAGGGKDVKRGLFHKVVFNFPHVGGLTKDVNRQVRHNQELLVGFFKAATPLLRPEGTIVLTIFEGEPYELWNIRDLARHVALKVQRSFKFQANAYPRYQHVRTIGNIEGGGGWKGNDRPARSYVFGLSDGPALQVADKNPKSKESDSEDQ